MPSWGDLARQFIRKGGQMEKRKWMIVALIAIVAFGVVGYAVSLQSNKNSTKPDAQAVENQTDIGVIDMSQVLKAHPKYGQTIELQKELNTLKAEIDNKLNFINHQAMPNSIAVDEKAILSSQNQLGQQQLIAKHAELNEKLQKKEDELRQSFNEQMNKDVAVIDEEYMPEIFNLKLKMKTLQMTEDAFNQMQAKINELQEARNKKVHEKQQQYLSQLGEQMKAEQQKATEEFNLFAQQVEKENKEFSSQKTAGLTERNNNVDNQGNESVAQIAELKQQVADKEVELQKIQDEILDEATSLVAKVALENNLSVVINKVKVNINGLDITDLVIQGFNK